MNVRRPWVVVTGYPDWPSPYFAGLDQHAPDRLHLDFAPDLDAVLRRTGIPGVVNLHRLKRLYRDAEGTATRTAAEALLDRLAELRGKGWHLVWTVHNLLPIDGGTDNEADRIASEGVLALADALITHTHADAAYLAQRSRAPVTVAGWAGLPTRTDGDQAPGEVVDLAARMRRAPCAILALGNLTAYKGLPEVTRAFVAHTRHAELFIVGPCNNQGLLDAVTEARAGSERVHLATTRIPPEHAHLLYRPASFALCPYRIDGRWEFFTKILYPGSVATALSFGTTVIAPDLPSIREMTAARPRLLYDPRSGPGESLRRAEEMRRPTMAGSPPGNWADVTAEYANLAARFTAGAPAVSLNESEIFHVE